LAPFLHVLFLDEKNQKSRLYLFFNAPPRRKNLNKINSPQGLNIKKRLSAT
jgi:hypothetical protein